ELVQRLRQRRQCMRIESLVRVEQGGAVPMGSCQEPAGPTEQLVVRILGARKRVELPQLKPQSLASLAGGPKPLAQNLELERVGFLRALENSRRPEVVEQVLRRRLALGEQRASCEGQNPSPERGVAERDPAIE